MARRGRSGSDDSQEGEEEGEGKGSDSEHCEKLDEEGLHGSGQTKRSIYIPSLPSTWLWTNHDPVVCLTLLRHLEAEAFARTYSSSALEGP